MDGRFDSRQVWFWILPLVLISPGCGSDILVQVQTTVLPGGVVERRVEALESQRLDEAGHPKPDRLLEVARPAVWKHIEEKNDRLILEGTFGTAADVPPAFSLSMGDQDQKPRHVEERDRLRLESSDCVVLTHWRWREIYSDPIEPVDPGPVLDRLTEKFILSFREEIRRQLGEAVDTTRAEALIRGEGRLITGQLAEAMRGTSALENEKDMSQTWTRVSRALGLPVAETADGTQFLDSQIWVLMARAREKVALALSTPDFPVAPEDLAFWPISEDHRSEKPDFLESLLDGPEGEELVQALFGGFFGEGGGHQFRFVMRVVLPGRLLRTNGAPDDNAATWFFRSQNIRARGVTLDAESFAFDTSRLRRLGARTDLGPAAALEIVDILETGDPQGHLRSLLLEAIEKRNLNLLRQRPEKWPGDPALADNLADLFDPQK